jgi:hypothetical protein
LKITLPAGASGKAEVVVMLVAEDGSVLGEVKSTLVITVAASGAQPQFGAPPMIVEPNATPQPVPAKRLERGGPQSPPPAMQAQDRERALKLLKEGQQQMDQGNVAAARVVFELAADAGLGQAAMALAGTYDGAELARLNVRGIQPNPREAKRWYQRAMQLGASDADERLRRLGAN